MAVYYPSSNSGHRYHLKSLLTAKAALYTLARLKDRIVAPKSNPLKLNALQLKTLTLLQELARSPKTSTPVEETDDVRITNFPHIHGNHFHIGGGVAMAKDASGLRNENVWRALERKGLARAFHPLGIILTSAGIAYDTGMRDRILLRTDH